MKITYDRQSLKSGERLRAQAEENPGTMATYNGADINEPSPGLAAKNSVRKAGPGGYHALELMNNPEAAMATNNWMEQFGQSVQGGQFNAKKEQDAQAQATLNITNQELGRKG